MDKKKLGWSLFAVLLAILSILAVLSQAGNLSLQDLKTTLAEANPFWLVMAVLAMLGFIVFEGQAVLCLLRSIGFHRKHRQGFLFAAGDVYFSAITPSATGGQPASAFFMRQSGIPVSAITAVLIMNLVMYTLGILTVGAICLVTAPYIFLHFNIFSRILIIFGYLALGMLGTAFVLLLIRRSILESILKWLLRFLHRIHLLRHPKDLLDKLEHKMDDYQDCVLEMRGKRSALVQTYFWNLAQRVSQISVTVFMYLATGGKTTKAYAVWVTQSLVAIGSNTVPVPGGMGVADFLMVDGFRDMMGNTSAIKLELLSRSLGFYICVLVSGITVAIGYSINKMKQRKRLDK